MCIFVFYTACVAGKLLLRVRYNSVQLPPQGFPFIIMQRGRANKKHCCRYTLFIHTETILYALTAITHYLSRGIVSEHQKPFVAYSAHLSVSMYLDSFIIEVGCLVSYILHTSILEWNMLLGIHTVNLDCFPAKSTDWVTSCFLSPASDQLHRDTSKTSHTACSTDQVLLVSWPASHLAKSTRLF